MDSEVKGHCDNFFESALNYHSKLSFWNGSLEYPEAKITKPQRVKSRLARGGNVSITFERRKHDPEETKGIVKSELWHLHSWAFLFIPCGKNSYCSTIPSKSLFLAYLEMASDGRNVRRTACFTTYLPYSPSAFLWTGAHSLSGSIGGKVLCSKRKEMRGFWHTFTLPENI